MTTRQQVIADWVMGYGRINGFGPWADPTLNDWIVKLDKLGVIGPELTAMDDLLRANPLKPDEAKAIAAHWQHILREMNTVRSNNRAVRDATEATEGSRRTPAGSGCEFGCTHGYIEAPHPECICMVNRTWNNPRSMYTCVVTCRCHLGIRLNELRYAAGPKERKHSTLDDLERALGHDWREMMAERLRLLQHRWMEMASRTRKVADDRSEPAMMGNPFAHLKKRALQ